MLEKNQTGQSVSKYLVNILAPAEQDLLDIYHYVAENDSPEKADYLLNKLEEVCSSLEYMPERGHIPEELRRLALQNYREIHFKPYRIFYQTHSKNIYIHCILDGRRDLNSILLRRLLKE